VSSFLTSALDVVNDQLQAPAALNRGETRLNPSLGWKILRRNHSLATVGNITPIPQLYKQVCSDYTKRVNASHL